MAAPSWPPAFGLEVEVGNNLWSLEKIYSPVSEEEILELQRIPPVLLARETLDFRLPLKQTKEWEWGFRISKPVGYRSQVKVGNFTVTP